MKCFTIRFLDGEPGLKVEEGIEARSFDTPDGPKWAVVAGNTIVPSDVGGTIRAAGSCPRRGRFTEDDGSDGAIVLVVGARSTRALPYLVLSDGEEVRISAKRPLAGRVLAHVRGPAYHTWGGLGGAKQDLLVLPRDSALVVEPYNGGGTYPAKVVGVAASGEFYTTPEAYFEFGLVAVDNLPPDHVAARGGACRPPPLARP
ncbi:MAG: hypothetical protein NZM07_01300, partial [Elioraea sp.]|nr:hypothetical protein [Elioraea sp.]